MNSRDSQWLFNRLINNSFASQELTFNKKSFLFMSHLLRFVVVVIKTAWSFVFFFLLLLQPCGKSLNCCAICAVNVAYSRACCTLYCWHNRKMFPPLLPIRCWIDEAIYFIIFQCPLPNMVTSTASVSRPLIVSGNFRHLMSSFLPPSSTVAFVMAINSERHASGPAPTARSWSWGTASTTTAIITTIGVIGR